MSTSIFSNKAVIPDDTSLAEVFGSTNTLWDHIFEYVKEKSDALGAWKFYSKKAGWSYVVKSGKRTLFYMIPQNGYFKLTFVFGDKAFEEAKKSNLPESIIRCIEEAIPYVEGRSFMVDIKNNDDLELSKQLLKIKENN